MNSFDYFAVILPFSRYAGQGDGKPFPVSFSPADDGYHWTGNHNRYCDSDLILLVPCPDPTEKYEPGHLVYLDDDQEPLPLDWFRPILNRSFVKSPFNMISKNGNKIADCRASQ